MPQQIVPQNHFLVFNFPSPLKASFSGKHFFRSLQLFIQRKICRFFETKANFFLKTFSSTRLKNVKWNQITLSVQNFWKNVQITAPCLELWRRRRLHCHADKLERLSFSAPRRRGSFDPPTRNCHAGAPSRHSRPCSQSCCWVGSSPRRRHRGPRHYEAMSNVLHFLHYKLTICWSKENGRSWEV
jgi:hypothetical protein